jgi:hypothetical protein
MFNYKVLFALLIAMSPVALKAVPIVESDFGSDSSTITFDGLGLPFENGSLNLNGQDISSNSGSVRYGDYGVCPGECVGTDLGVAPSVSLVVQLAISPEFNQFGAAWEHLCHAIPKNAKPLC